MSKVDTDDQDRVYGVLSQTLEPLEGPWPWKPNWWQFKLSARDRYIRRVLAEAKLPPLTEHGRRRYHAADPQGFEDAGGAWSRKWCAALGLAYRDAYSDFIHPRLQPQEPTHE